ncbi:MAG TPA: adenylate/guanylate cyclase domain-containing protein [Xanthobacteraceae bacterium]|nr:adenylate/guanylate cyclase domain-containing protein [Xanthobacteraceae bacterium]
MFAYVTTHFVNHALGLVSVQVMDQALQRIYQIWASPLGGLMLYGAFAIHYSLALWALWKRRSLTMPFAEATQLVLGFSIPFFLTDHVLQTRVADTFYGSDYGYYSSVLYTYFVANPPRGGLQLTVLVIAWIHAMIGLRFWLSLKPWYDRWQPILYAFALLMPTLAILGFLEGGRQVMALAADPAWVAELAKAHPRPAPEDVAVLDQLVVWVRSAFLAALLAVLAARSVRWYWERRRGLIRLTYTSGRVVQSLRGVSVLEASRMAGIPHASVCGGRGRCSTCRIKVEGAQEAIPPPASEETRVLRRVGAAPDVRLACQLRPRGDLRVTPLLPATAQARDGFHRPGYLHGVEREIVILFGDLRAFTRLSEKKLPYDLVFLLNQYFAEMGRAVEAAGGRIDKFIGDGVMALFGLDSGVEAGCREALVAAMDMARRMQGLNRALIDDITEPLRIGIGIHTGTAIVGEMGYGTAISITAVGDSVNTASRIESLSKTYACELVVSEAVVLRAGVDLGTAPRHEIEIRGRVERLVVRTFTSALDLPIAEK